MRPAERVDEATSANEYFYAALWALWRRMLEECDRGRGTSGIREAADHLHASLHVLEAERGRMTLDHLRYNDPEVAALVTTFGDLMRPGAIDERVRSWAPHEPSEHERLAKLPEGSASLRIDEA